MTVRALRNNNPGNVVAGDPWLGLCPPEDMSPEQKAETRFAVFKTPMWGFRAMALILLNYYRNHGIRTVHGIIARWAPPTENITQAYIDDVAKQLGVLPDENLAMENENTLRGLCMAISKHECDGWLFALADLDAGVEAALNPKPVGVA